MIIYNIQCKNNNKIRKTSETKGLFSLINKKYFKKYGMNGCFFVNLPKI